ncbi:MAG TPA: LacI family DNA-binding transcriptional regulator [Capsulimonadaceae bacterium]|jgi:LacI family transcriptional regulator
MTETPSLALLDDLSITSYGNCELPLHEVVRNGLRSVINDHFKDGQRFWTEAEVQEKLNVSRVTVRRALTALVAEGCLVRHRSRGSFVRVATVGSMPDGRSIRDHERPKSVGIFAPYSNSEFWGDVIDQLSVVAGESGLSCHVYSYEKGEPGESIIAQVATKPSDETLVLLGDTNIATAEIYRLLTARGFYAIVVDMPIREFPAPFVGSDNDMGVYMGMRHLIELGHRRITMLSIEPPNNVNTQLRVNAFTAAALENGLTDTRVCHIDLTIPASRAVPAAMDSIWDAPAHRPTAIFCDSADSSVAALKWCVEQGIAVPGDVSILGFDTTRQVQFARPPLTCIAQPLREIAEVVVELLERPAMRHILLPPKLIVRESTAAQANHA